MISVVFAVALHCAPAQVPVASADVNARVESLYGEGVALYRAGKYRLAIEKFQAAYALYPEPNLLYNEARAQEAIGDQQMALTKYRAAYNHNDATDDLRAKSSARITFLEAVIKNSANAAEPAPAALVATASRTPPAAADVVGPSSAAEQDDGPGVGVWVAAGLVGAGAAAAGITAAVLLIPGPAHASTLPTTTISGK